MGPVNGDIESGTIGVVAIGHKAEGRDVGVLRFLLLALAAPYRSSRLAPAWTLSGPVLCLPAGVKSLSAANGSCACAEN